MVFALIVGVLFGLLLILIAALTEPGRRQVRAYDRDVARLARALARASRHCEHVCPECGSCERCTDETCVTCTTLPTREQVEKTRREWLATMPPAMRAEAIIRFAELDAEHERERAVRPT